jgi:hypothetical protein
MNVFLFLWYFFLGVVVGLLTVRSKSLLPAVIFHFCHNSFLIGFSYLLTEVQTFVVGFCLMVALVMLWILYRRPYVALARQLAREEKIAQTSAVSVDGRTPTPLA